jgi:hypothetical protein
MPRAERHGLAATPRGNDRPCAAAQTPERPTCVFHGSMLDTCFILTRMNADLLALAAKSVGTAWVLLASGAARSCWGSAPGNPDLETLGLNQMPPSKAELRTAYRRAAKAAHPDAGGSAEAFLAVSEAFRRLTRSNTRAA